MKKQAVPGLMCLALAVVLILPASSSATIVPFEETFATGVSGWITGGTGTVLLDWNAAGGSDGGGFASTVFNFQNSPANSTPPIIHGPSTASGGAFAGNWIADGVNSFSAYVRHDAGMPLPFFMRVAPFAGPGAVGLISAPVPSGVWTPIEWSIFPGNPQNIFEGTTFDTAFANVVRVQIGVFTPEALAGVDQDFVFSVDQVAITPEPGAVGLLSAGVLLAGVRARRARRSA